MRPELMVGVEVPATSANLGPGFDAFAVALDCRLTVWTAPRQDRRVLTEGEGAGELPAGDDNLIWRALVAFCSWAGCAPPEVSLRARNAIPLERGLGSSAAAAVAGAALGRALVGGSARDQDLVDLAAALEGHPDNAAAAILGGLVVCVDGRARRLAPSDRLRPVLCIPPTRQSTVAARGLLPDQVPLADAAANGARAALVLAGLAGELGWEPEVVRDVLHEPARFRAMPASGELVAALRAAGVAACLSGAGPSVLAIVERGDAAALETVRERAGERFEVRPTAWDLAGASVCPTTVAV